VETRKAGARHVSRRARRISAVIRVAAGLIRRGGRYLIARRKADAHLGGCWEFPGGKCEPGESLRDCLRRELREELGIVITNPVPFCVIRHAYPGKIVELHVFRCTVGRGEARALACDEVRWVTPEELARYEFPPADRPLLAALRQRRPSRVKRGRMSPMVR
jgi:mutator protein MutT